MPLDPPPGLIAVPVPKAVLLLTQTEYLAGIRRGKWWARLVGEQRREAHRQIGEMLKATKPERAKGARGNPRGRGAPIVQLPTGTAQPTLADLGIGKKESHEAQKLADMPTQ